MMPSLMGRERERERERERVEENRVKLAKNKLILGHFYFTVYSALPVQTKHKRVQTVILGNKIPPKNRPETGFPSICMPV